MEFETLKYCCTVNLKQIVKRPLSQIYFLSYEARSQEFKVINIVKHFIQFKRDQPCVTQIARKTINVAFRHMIIEKYFIVLYMIHLENIKEISSISLFTFGCF